jgi:cold shock CspA family protein
MKDKKYCGQVVLWDDKRSFGFIRTTELLSFGEQQIFVHRSNCIDDLYLGAHCEFEIGDAYKINRKPQAVRVKVSKNAAGLNVLAEAFREVGCELSDRA